MMPLIRLLLAVLGLSAASAAAAPLPPMIDAHAHYSAPDVEPLSPAAVLAGLDATGVRRLVVTGSPPQLAQVLYRTRPSASFPCSGYTTRI